MIYGSYSRHTLIPDQSFEDLSIISHDLDSATSLPFTPLSVLQASHWTAADLRSRLSREYSRNISPPIEENYELGLSYDTMELVAQKTQRRPLPQSRIVSPTTGTFPRQVSRSNSLSSLVTPPQADPLYRSLHSDDTHRIGAGGLLSFFAATPPQGTMDLLDFGPDDSHPAEGASRTNIRPPPQGEDTCFGLLAPMKTLGEISQRNTDHDLKTRWTSNRPYRFSVEYWNLDKLPEKERAYSKTHFYAGSWFNVYVQNIRKKDKGVQLGIYLHRQSPTEPFPIPSGPEYATEKSSVELSSLARGMATSALAKSSQTHANIATNEDEPYRDPRRCTKVKPRPHDLSSDVECALTKYPS